MINFSKKKTHFNKLYNKILLLSRDNLFYTRLSLADTFQNRINLIFLHISFLFIKVKQDAMTKSYKQFNQEMFNFIFKKIEINMREIGHGDTTVTQTSVGVTLSIK